MERSSRRAAGAWAKKLHLTARAAIDQMLRPYDIGSTQWYVLWHLYHDGPMAQRVLLIRLEVEKATLSGVIATLVRKGLADQATDPADHRQKLLSITEAGRKLWESLPDPVEEIVETAFADIPEEDLATVVRVLSTGTERLQHLLQKGKKS